MQKIMLSFGDYRNIEGSKTCVNFLKKVQEYDKDEVNINERSPSPVRFGDSPGLK